MLHRINITHGDDNNDQMVKSLFFINNVLCYYFWKEINLKKSIEYFKYYITKVNFTLDTGRKLYKIISIR